MKRFLKSIIVILLFLAGTVFLTISHADRGKMKEISNGREMECLPSYDSRKKALPLGPWGGEHISIEVTEQGATIEYDCAHAAIDQRIILDRRGRFDVPGMQVPERGGPVRQNDERPGDPVRFTGQVTGKRMKLSVRNTATKELIGTFTLVYRAQPKLKKCR